MRATPADVKWMVMQKKSEGGGRLREEETPGARRKFRDYRGLTSADQGAASKASSFVWFDAPV